MKAPATASCPAWTRIVADVSGGAGPTLLCVGGVHGNEHAGLRAAVAVGERLREVGAGALHGRFLAVAGHLGALNSGEDSRRYFVHDLNRLFRPDRIRAAREKTEGDRSPDERELLELLAILEGVAGGGPCVLLDLHTVSSPSPAFCCIEDSLPARELGLALGLPLILGFEEELEGLLIDYATSELGMPALVVEAGVHDDPRAVRVHEAAIWVMLQRLGLMGDIATAGFDPRAELAAAAGRQAGRVYDIRARTPVGDPPMALLERAQAFTRVWKGITEVGVRTLADGSRLTVRAPADGILFMPNRQKRREPGDDAFFVLRPVARRLMGLSARVRRARWAHRVLAALPGVWRDPAHPATLRVDHAVAAILARDVLHLFGYRVHDAAHGPYRRRMTRAAMAVWVLPLAVLRAAGLRGGGPREVWSVRRRRLDLEPPVGSSPGTGGPGR